jgi:pyroglutamyl-peptidase
MHHLAGQPVRAGFIHVPFLPEQAAAYPGGAPGMALEDIVAGLRVAVEVAVAVAVEGDVSEVGGATH